MAAQSTARHHPDLKPFYQDLCQRGKAKKVALVVVMHKLLLQLNAVYRRRGNTESLPRTYRE